MSDLFEGKVNRGQPFEMTAETFNDMLDVIRWWKRQANNLTGKANLFDPIKSNHIVLVWNGSGDDISDSFRILKLGQGVITNIEENTHRIHNRMAIEGGPILDASDPIAILTAPVADEELVKAVVGGFTVCRVKINSSSHDWANPVVGSTAHLESAESGQVRIIWYHPDDIGSPEAAGVKWAIVNLIGSKYDFDSGGSDLDGTGTANYLTRWVDTDTLGSTSLLYNTTTKTVVVESGGSSYIVLNPNVSTSIPNISLSKTSSAGIGYTIQYSNNDADYDGYFGVYSNFNRGTTGSGPTNPNWGYCAYPDLLTPNLNVHLDLTRFLHPTVGSTGENSRTTNLICNSEELSDTLTFKHGSNGGAVFTFRDVSGYDSMGVSISGDGGASNGALFILSSSVAFQLPRYAVVDSGSTRRIGVYGTDPVGNKFAGGICYEIGEVDVGGGSVDSVNGQTGVVVLDASDVGADPAGSAATALAAANAYTDAEIAALDFVTSVGLVQPAAGITVTGSPITGSGDITLALADDLLALENLTGSNVIPYRSAADTWGTVTIGSGLSFTAGTLSASTLADGDKGDITVSASGATWTIDANAVTNTKLRDSAALSVIGRSANSSGDPADIAATADGQVLRRVAGTLGWGAAVLTKYEWFLSADYLITAANDTWVTVSTVPSALLVDAGTYIVWFRLRWGCVTSSGFGAIAARLIIDGAVISNSQTLLCLVPAGANGQGTAFASFIVTTSGANKPVDIEVLRRLGTTWVDSYIAVGDANGYSSIGAMRIG